jgi:hypothetical protein
MLILYVREHHEQHAPRFSSVLERLLYFHCIGERILLITQQQSTTGACGAGPGHIFSSDRLGNK